MSSTIIIITPPPTKPKRPNVQLPAAPRVKVITVDLIENATDAEILHAALTELEAE